MFNTYKFSRQKFTRYSIFLLLWLTTLLLYHFFKTNFSVFNNVMHLRSFLNLTFFIFQSIFYLWHISMLIYLSGDIETQPGLLLIFFKILKYVTGNLTLFNLGGGGSFLPAGFLISYNFLSVYGMNLKFCDFS